MNNTQSTPGVHLPSQPENLGRPVRETTNIDIMMCHGITKLNGKSMSKLIH